MGEDARAIHALLAPTDGSDCSFRALEFATDVAERYDATLDVVHITDARSPKTEAVLDRAETIIGASDVEAAVSVLTDLDLELRPADQVGETVLHLVETEGYDHVVMGHHGAGTFERAVIGSAAETVLHAERVPVTVVP